jgi:hypothetical protein
MNQWSNRATEGGRETNCQKDFPPRVTFTRQPDRTMRLLFSCFLAALLSSTALSAPVAVAVSEAPEKGLQPRLFVDDKGTLHALWYAGDAGSGDVFHATRSSDKAWSKAVRVNSEPGSAIAAGTIRGAQVSLGRDGMIHVVWNGSNAKLPKGSHMPLCYTRSVDGGRTFEPQRTVSGDWPMDGGGAVASDVKGNVHVLWHAGKGMGKGTEIARRVYIRSSENDGKNFAEERVISPEGLGVCACCAMQALATRDGHGVYVLFRSAYDGGMSRNIISLVSHDGGKTFAHAITDKWTIAACPMSSMALVESPRGVIGAWERAGQVYFGVFDGPANAPTSVVSPGGKSEARKHPVLAVDEAGEILMAWTEGTGWKKGGSLAWQVFGKDLKPLESKDARGGTGGVPVWSFGGVAATTEGFVVVK